MYGIDRVLVLHFDARLRAMTAQAFEQQLLHEGLGAHHVVVGHDFHYGTKRAGTVETLTAAGQRLGFTLAGSRTIPAEGERVSSSLVREALERGRARTRGQLIGRPYRMTGRVRRGQQLGRTLGFPTANLALQRKVVPLWGIFAARVFGAGITAHPAVVSLGTRPTINGTDPLLEVHLFDFDRDLYGQYLSVDFVRRLRDEKKFASLDALRRADARRRQRRRAARLPAEPRRFIAFLNC